jgi:hypothetical protein
LITGGSAAYVLGVEGDGRYRVTYQPHTAVRKLNERRERIQFRPNQTLSSKLWRGQNVKEVLMKWCQYGAGSALFALVLVLMPLQASVAQEAPPNTGTPEETAKLAAAAGKYDIAGMKLGTPLKDTMQALKAHNPKMQMKKETIKYDVLGGELLYGLTFLSPEERFVFRLTMPPNPVLVSKLSRMLIFTKETAPTQQTLVEDLIKKYGTPSSDSGASQLNDANQRILIWLDDANGNRLKSVDQTCLSNASFSSGNGSQGVDPVPMQQMEAGMRVESRFAIGAGHVCQTYRMVQAGLRRCCQNALAAPDLVGAITVTMGDGPLDEKSTGATHELLVNAVKSKDEKEKAGAQKNRPKL